MEPILSVENLSVSFQRYGRGLSRVELRTVRDLSLRVEPGQLAAVVGESGSGKSLLAHAILHILPRNAQVSGTIRYDGLLLTSRRAEELRGREIALIPQGITCLDPMMKVGPQVRRGRNDPETRARCRQVLARFGLGPEVEDLYPFELSGGMARRVLIACAVMEQPRLIVADEPTPGLDPKTARRILGHLRELAQGGTGVLLITHDLELALSAADKITVFREGRAVDEVPAAAFQTGEGLDHPYTQALWRAMPKHEFL
ncbi:MAG: ABC transporter ATP-binding protein [Lawsonibacter sp.]|jgi:peptide/nickel transport system ATP-binding protein|nr:ABC transporter ATP-binding protein [Lawsonibacter sp.]